MTGIIDWDGVRTVPRCNGNEAYPYWIMSDWDPDHQVHEADRVQNTPAEVARYRTMYLDFMDECRAAAGPTDGPNMTKVSQVANQLEFACSGEGRTSGVYCKILREIAVIAANDPRAPAEAMAITVPLIKFVSGKEENPEKAAISFLLALAKRLAKGTATEDEMGMASRWVCGLCLCMI